MQVRSGYSTLATHGGKFAPNGADFAAGLSQIVSSPRVSNVAGPQQVNRCRLAKCERPLKASHHCSVLKAEDRFRRITVNNFLLSQEMHFPESPLNSPIKHFASLALTPLPCLVLSVLVSLKVQPWDSYCSFILLARDRL